MNGLSLSELSGEPPSPPSAPGRHGIVACGSVQVPAEGLVALRRSLGPPGGPPYPATYLKSSEEQTVVAVAALGRAAQDFGLRVASFEKWGLVAAPRSLARLAAAESLHRFEQGGPPKVTSLLSAHRSLHSISGTLSQGFNIRGPNFGVGGHTGAVAEGLLAALTMLDEGQVPGVWLVLTECDPEPVPDCEGNSLVPVVYRAVALGLRPGAVARAAYRLELVRQETRAPAVERPATVAEVARFFAEGAALSPGWSLTLNWGTTLRLTRTSGETVTRRETRQVA